MRSLKKKTTGTTEGRNPECKSIAIPTTKKLIVIDDHLFDEILFKRSESSEDFESGSAVADYWIVAIKAIDSTSSQAMRKIDGIAQSVNEVIKLLELREEIGVDNDCYGLKANAGFVEVSLLSNDKPA